MKPKLQYGKTHHVQHLTLLEYLFIFNFVFIFIAAPINLKFMSAGLKKYTISWSQPSLPKKQTLLAYYGNYRASQGVNETLNISKEMRSITVDVEFDKQYTFEVQVETEAGKSDMTNKSWFAHSGIQLIYKCKKIHITTQVK